MVEKNKTTGLQGENGGWGGGDFIDSAVGGKLSEYLVSRSQLGPGLVSSPIVILGVGDFHVLVEPQDFSGLQLRNGWPLTQLQETVVNVTFFVLQSRDGDICCGCATLTFLVSRRLISRTSACLSA